MQEVLFRGKGTINSGHSANKWAYGYYCKDFWHPRKGHGILPIDKECGGHVEVDPETVGQYTGIYTMEEIEGGDTRCTFIYEGDIVEPVLTDGIHEGFSWGRQVVVFDRGAFCLKDRRGITTPMCNYAASVKFKVLGNVWDNPELMEVTE